MEVIKEKLSKNLSDLNISKFKKEEIFDYFDKENIYAKLETEEMFLTNQNFRISDTIKKIDKEIIYDYVDTIKKSKFLIISPKIKKEYDIIKKILNTHGKNYFKYHNFWNDELSDTIVQKYFIKYFELCYKKIIYCENNKIKFKINDVENIRTNYWTEEETKEKLNILGFNDNLDNIKIFCLPTEEYLQNLTNIKNLLSKTLTFCINDCNKFCSKSFKIIVKEKSSSLQYYLYINFSENDLIVCISN